MIQGQLTTMLGLILRSNSWTTILQRLLWTVVAVPIFVGGLGADEDSRFLQGLRQRRLFGLAETHCQRRLADPGLQDADRALLTTELIRVYAEHAANSSPEQRAGRWRLAHQLADRFQISNADHPQLVLVLVQDALAYVAQGELARREAEIAAAPDEPLLAARQTIRQAVALWEDLDRRLPKAIQSARRRAEREADLSAAQLSSLHQSVRFQLARTYRNRALCYPPQSADRIAALSQSLDLLGKPLQELPAESKLVRRIQLDQVVCHRLLSAWEPAGQLLTHLEQQELQPVDALRVRAERVRLWLARNETQQALRTIELGRELNGVVSAELDFAHLETYVSLWQLAAESGDVDGKQRWQQRSIAAVEFIEQTHGPYWARRAELLLIGTGRNRGGGSLEILVRTAADLFLKGRLDESLQTYEQASAAANAAGRSDQAFELSYKAALIERQRKHNREASQRFHQLAQDHHDHPAAGNAHFWAVACAAEAVKSKTLALADYVELLEQHLRQWQHHPTANPVAVWLGKHREAEQDWPLALAAYRQVARESEQFTAAMGAAERCWSKWLAQREQSGQPTGELAAQAVDFCSQVADSAQDPWSKGQRIAAVFAARVLLEYLPERADEARVQLEAALNASSTASQAWDSTARALLLASVAMSPGRADQAKRELDALPAMSSQRLLTISEVLANGLPRVTPRRRPEIAKFQLAIHAKLEDRSTELDDSTQRRLAVIRAEALVACGREGEAITAYAKLAETYVDDVRLQLSYARLLLESATNEDLKTGLDRWRMIVQRARRRSDVWFEAKYSVALAQVKLGHKQAAAKLIRYVSATENLAAAGWKKQFDELLRRCWQ